MSSAPSKPASASRPGQPLEIAFEDRPDRGVEHSRAGALVVAHLGQHFGRDADIGLRHQAPEFARRRPLVGRVGVGVHEANGDGLHIGADKSPRGSLYVARFQRECFLARRQNAAAHRQAQPARHQRPRRQVLVVVQFLADAAAHLQRVAETMGRQQPGLRRRAGQHGVGRNGRAVDDALDIGEEGAGRPAFGRRHLRQAGHHGVRRIVRRRQDLEDPPRAVRVLKQEIRKRPADIDADRVCHARAGSALAFRLVIGMLAPVHRKH